MYKRAVIKVSGEAIGKGKETFNFELIEDLGRRLAQLTERGHQIGLVVGGGNIIRGISAEKVGIDRVVGDMAGMLATVINALIIRDVFERCGAKAAVQGSFEIPGVIPKFGKVEAMRLLKEGYIVIWAGGTGNPFFSTDTAAALRAVEVEADVLVKATKVGGVYSEDPVKNPNAEKYDKLTYDEVLARKLAVMDMTAFALCRDNRLPIIVLNLFEEGALERALAGELVGTIVTSGGD